MAQKESTSMRNFKPWTCDELTPDLCDLQVETGFVNVRGIDIAYWKYTSEKGTPSTSDGLPIVTIHGGPAWSHNYMLPLKQQACRGRDVYFYDTAGCGKSVLPDSMNETLPFWLSDVNYYKEEELPALLDYWALKEFHLVGNSFGGVIAMLYNLDHRQSNVAASLVLSSSLSDTQLMFANMWKPDLGSVGRLPPFVVHRLEELLQDNALESPEYGDIVMDTYRDSIVRTNPFPSCVVETFSQSNSAVTSAMYGPASDVVGISGTMEHWNITDQLHEINVPVLLTVGRYDPMYGAPTATLQDNIPITEVVVLERSGHLGMVDEPGPSNDVMADFFDRVESARKCHQAFVPRTYTVDKNDGASTLVSWHVVSCVVLLVAGILSGRVWGIKSAQKAGYTHI